MSHAQHFIETATTLEVLNEVSDDPFVNGTLAHCLDLLLAGDAVTGKRVWRQLVEQGAAARSSKENAS
ncbi:hypothetical protein [Aquitalea sp. USM4]|uniref:hypothetical protein n=1 Tax=Aquitalea sp. USM4 TaxID=1590041 RepID=UPI00103EC53C|nr:hypothetical protein [Aquitalea sp. USM4]QBJ80543.1 hypothetical protein DKK66_20065 [Aquitalea sp. USM4]